MSQYLNLYIRTKAGFVPMQSYCRSSYMYEAFEEIAIYERVRPVSESDLIEIMREVESRIARANESITNLMSENDQIGKMNNSVEEKLEFIEQNNQSISEYRDEINDMNVTLGRLAFLNDMLEDMEMHLKYVEDYPDSVLGYDHNKILYVGIEAPMSPTEIDIVD